MPLRQVLAASGSIETDVGWRDYRLVLQADSLVACCPVLNNRPDVSGGVRDEINFARTNGKPIYIYQDPGQDEENHARREINKDASAMGPSDYQDLVNFCDSIDDALARASAV